MPIRFDRPPQRPSPRKQPGGRPVPRRSLSSGPSPAELAALAAERQTLRERFDRTMKDKFSLVPVGGYPTTIKGLDTIRLMHAGVDPEHVRQIFVYPYYPTPDGKHRRAELTLDHDGTLMGTLPQAIRGTVRKEDIYREVLDDMDAIGLGKFRIMGIDALPVGGFPVPPPAGGDGEWEPELPDLARIEFLRKQRDALFAFYNPYHGGFGSYFVVAFRQFLYMEKARTKNAAYFYDLERPLDPEDVPADPEAFRTWVEQRPWFSVITGTKSEALLAGAQRKWHHAGDWQKTLQQEIDRRSAPRGNRATPTAPVAPPPAP